MCTVPEDSALVASTISSTPRASVPSSTTAVFQISRRKRRRETEIGAVASSSVSASTTTNNSNTVIVDSETNSIILSDNDATTDNTLLRRLLAGADLATVRNHSVLVDGNFSLRRTSSMSLGPSQRPSSNVNTHSINEVTKPRRSTMFSQYTHSRRSPNGGSPDRGGAEDSRPPMKRIRDASGGDVVSSDGSSPGFVQTKPQSPGNHPEDANNLTFSSSKVNKNRSHVPMKPTQRWRQTRQPPAHSLSPPAMPSVGRSDFNGASPMRPRARTVSELDRDFSRFAQRLHTSAGVATWRDMCNLATNPASSKSSSADKARRALDAVLRGEQATEKLSDMTSPLSQLLESTPPYTSSSSSTVSNIHTRANTICSRFPWSSTSMASAPNSSCTRNTNTATTSSSLADGATGVCLPFLHGNSSLRIMSTANPSKRPDLQVHELHHHSTPSVTSAADTVASIIAATSRQFLQGIRDEQVLDYSRKEVLDTPPKSQPMTLPLATDDILQWSSAAASQAATLQQLFSLPSAGPVQPPVNPRSSANPDDRQTAREPVRLSAVDPLPLCRRVAEWLLVANAWTMQLCPPATVPPNALLATAAMYSYCRCSEAEMHAAPPIPPTLVMPKISPALRSVLHRIWPPLLLASMVRENFSFSVAPIPPTDLNALLGREAAVNGTVLCGGVSANYELNIAKMGTATALKSLIEAGNPLLLDTQVLECVRKCIFSQHAYPTFYSIPYATAMEDLRRCCQASSADSSLFNNVVFIMNEMQSINPEGLHCLFSIDRLSGLFAPAT